MRLLRQFISDQSGTTAVEYGIMAIGIALAVVVAVDLTGQNLGDGVYTDITTLF